MEERDAWQPTLQAVVPVVTDPAIVQTSVTGMLFGKITLTASNVEPVLVLANAIGVRQNVSQGSTCSPLLSGSACQDSLQVEKLTCQVVCCSLRLWSRLALNT